MSSNNSNVVSAGGAPRVGGVSASDNSGLHHLHPQQQQQQPPHNADMGPRRTRVFWGRAEMDKLLSWIEQNKPDCIGHGRREDCARIKNEVFASRSDYTAKTIKEKLLNMEKKFKKAQELKYNSRGTNDLSIDSASIDEKVEKLCPFFSRIESLKRLNPNPKNNRSYAINERNYAPYYAIESGYQEEEDEMLIRNNEDRNDDRRYNPAASAAAVNQPPTNNATTNTNTTPNLNANTTNTTNTTNANASNASSNINASNPRLSRLPASSAIQLQSQQPQQAPLQQPQHVLQQQQSQQQPQQRRLPPFSPQHQVSHSTSSTLTTPTTASSLASVANSSNSSISTGSHHHNGGPIVNNVPHAVGGANPGSANPGAGGANSLHSGNSIVATIAPSPNAAALNSVVSAPAGASGVSVPLDFNKLISILEHRERRLENESSKRLELEQKRFEFEQKRYKIEKERDKKLDKILMTLVNRGEQGARSE